MDTGMDSILAAGGPGLSQGLMQAAAQGIKDKATIDKVSKDFESVFLSQMLSHMFENVGQDSLISDKESEEVYRSWLTDQYGSLIANAGGIGIAGYVRTELLKQQELATQQPADVPQPAPEKP